jgi:putative spermidine/putrescine transport system substrate-binding protein
MDEDIMIPLPNDCVAPNIIWSWVPFYSADRFEEGAPETIADFFDVKKFPGKRAIAAFPQANIEMALVADGVDPDRVYDVMSTPEGIDRAFAKLDSIKEHIVFWSSGDEPLELVSNNEVAMSTAYSGRVGNAILEDGAPYETIWDGHVIDEEWFVVVSGSDNRDLAIDFVVHASAPTQQAAQAKWITYGPMRRSAMEIIEKGEPWYNNGREVMPHLANREQVIPRTVISDSRWWAENSKKISDRFNKWAGF